MKWHLDEIADLIIKNHNRLEQNEGKGTEEQEKLFSYCKEFILLFEFPEKTKENYKRIQLILNKLSSQLKMMKKMLPLGLQNEEVSQIPFSSRTMQVVHKNMHAVENEWEKLIRMIDFYTIERVPQSGISKSLGATYTKLFFAESADAESLFFTLKQDGFRVYFKEMIHLERFKQYLHDFNIQNLQIVSAAEAPEINGFEAHKQYLIIPHLAIPKLFTLFNPESEPQTYLNDIYAQANLDAAKCRLTDLRQAVFQEADADFYKSYFDKIKPYATKDTLFGGFMEDEAYNEQDHRRYVGALFELNRNFTALTTEEQDGLNEPLMNLLKGLQSILIVPENDENAGVSRRLSNHFYQLYQFHLGDALPPYVLFEEQGCSFYFNHCDAIDLFHDQMEIHGIACSYLENEAENRPATHKVPKKYLHKATIPVCYNYLLMALGRIHPANIDIALRQAYENQGLDYVALLLKSSMEFEEKTTTPKIQATYALASLKSGEQIVRFSLAPQQEHHHFSMGHVLILLDDSGSMQDEKMQAAKQSCVRLIQELPLDTEITLIPFNAEAPRFHKVRKIDLPRDWVKQVLAIQAKGSTPLIARIVEASAMVSTRHFALMDEIRQSTIILLTDGEGDSQETAEEVLLAVQTGVYQGRDLSKCNHGLGTKDLPNRSTFPIIPIGIGSGYSADFVDGLGSFAGSYHIRDDKAQMQTDLMKMVTSVKQTFGAKIGPVYAGLLNEEKDCLITASIDLMLPATTRHLYTKLGADKIGTQLSSIVSVQSTCFSEAAVKVEEDPQIIIAGFFQCALDKLFERLYAAFTKAPKVHSSSRFQYLDETPKMEQEDLHTLVLPIKEALAALVHKIRDNAIDDVRLLKQVHILESLVADPSLLSQKYHELRFYHTQAARRSNGLVEEDDDALLDVAQANPSSSTASVAPKISLFSAPATNTNTLREKPRLHDAPLTTTSSASFFTPTGMESNPEILLQELSHSSYSQEESESTQLASHTWLISFLIGEIADLQVRHSQQHIKPKQLSMVLGWLQDPEQKNASIEKEVILIQSICARKNTPWGIQKPDSLTNFEALCLENGYTLPEEPFFELSILDQLQDKSDVSVLLGLIIDPSNIVPAKKESFFSLW